MDQRLLDIIGRVATQAAASVFAPCQVGECEGHSPGFVCARCSRALCRDHAYVSSATMPPRVICASCVVDRHPELWQAEEPKQSPRRPSSSATDGDDDDVLDAEWQEGA